jgi:formimidoylglutamate deiminase
MKLLEPDLLWRDGRFETGLKLEIGNDGVISRIGSNLTASGNDVQRLPSTALLPGMVNAHSHAFQRGLRGKAETFGSGSGTFWSWRDFMYRLASSLDVESFQRLTRLAFQEMLGAGITTVGEFHYVHHLSAAPTYELDEALVVAARDAGIRLVVLDACYLSGDVSKPLADDQRRFGSSSVEAFLESADRLEARLERNQSLGLVAHSLRAVPLEAVVALHEAARARGVVFHMHVEEQQREIDAVRAEYGQSPLALLLDRLELGAEFTAVHATHSDPGELTRLLATGANLCLCPLTEANLADGIPPPVVSDRGAQLSLGTDSNLRIDFMEEMRLLEYAQRLREQRRGVFTTSDGSVAKRLFQIATEGGARSLGVRAGRLEEGYAADFFTLNLDTPALAQTAPEELMTAFVFGAGPSAIQNVAVAGHWIR